MSYLVGSPFPPYGGPTPSFTYEVFVSIPPDPSLQTIILEGMQSGGQYTVTNTDSRYTSFAANQWQTLKTLIWNACRTDKLLEVQACVLGTVGNPNVTLPADYDSEIALWLYDSNPSYRGTAQGGSSTTITLSSTFSDNVTDMYGRYVFTLSGTGAGQFGTIVNYDDTSKIATINGTWTANPDSTTTYMVSIIRLELKRIDYTQPMQPNRRPFWYSRTGTTLSVWPAPDYIYPILLTYRSNLTRLDDSTSTVFIKHMRERRHLWVQGVKALTLGRYDDERYPQEMALFNSMLQQYAGQNVMYRRMDAHR